MRRQTDIVTKWYDIGLELLDDKGTLDVIKKNNPTDVDECCTEMFKKWLESKPDAKWDELVNVLNEVGLKSAVKYISKG